MNDRQKEALSTLGTDVEGAIYRFGGNEALYSTCLSAFLEDDSFPALRAALSAGDWGAATSAVHTLKGTSGNMGFVPLMRAAQQTLSLLRAGEYSQAAAAAEELESVYLRLTEGIRQLGLANA